MNDSGHIDKGKAKQVHGMFSGIAGRYDLLNAILSLGIDRSWRREAARAGFENGAQLVLAVATGTGDLAFALKRYAPQAQVTGLDFVAEMLEQARRKATGRGVDIHFIEGDALALPFPDGTFDLLTIAYGLRNLASVDAGLAEFQRVLRPGGRLVILEFPPPPRGFFGWLYRFYFSRVVPVVGGLVSGSRGAYTYLPDSVSVFMPPGMLADRLAAAGFTDVRYRLQSFGISAIHIADKPDLRGA
jgi:demethylmenaquinone methyltransferase/2-methoxy-6-polyprenyl-1,4-benzoquinol methylase